MQTSIPSTYFVLANVFFDDNSAEKCTVEGLFWCLLVALGDMQNCISFGGCEGSGMCAVRLALRF